MSVISPIVRREPPRRNGPLDLPTVLDAQASRCCARPAGSPRSAGRLGSTTGFGPRRSSGSGSLPVSCRPCSGHRPLERFLWSSPSPETRSGSGCPTGQLSAFNRSCRMQAQDSGPMCAAEHQGRLSHNGTRRRRSPPAGEHPASARSSHTLPKRLGRVRPRRSRRSSGHSRGERTPGRGRTSASRSARLPRSQSACHARRRCSRARSQRPRSPNGQPWPSRPRSDRLTTSARSQPIDGWSGADPASARPRRGGGLIGASARRR